jgi:hypothetical protein
MRLTKSKDLVEHVDNGECSVLNMQNGNFYGLHDVAAKIWTVLDETDNTSEIVDLLSRTYTNVEKEALKADINSFIKKLIREGLVKEI